MRSSNNEVNDNVQETDDFDVEEGAGLNALTLNKKDCYYCGYKWHPCRNCPVKDESCRKCGLKGHFMKVCRNKKNKASVASAAVSQRQSTPSKSSVLCASDLTSGMLAKSSVNIKLEN